MNSLMLAGLPVTARPAVPSAAPDDLDLTRAGLTAADAARIGEALAAARTDGTRRLYDVVWGQCQRWCAERGVAAVPADPLAVCAYLTERAEAGKATGTLDMACIVIRHVHRTIGAVDPVASEAVRQAAVDCVAPTVPHPDASPDHSRSRRSARSSAASTAPHHTASATPR